MFLFCMICMLNKDKQKIEGNVGRTHNNCRNHKNSSKNFFPSKNYAKNILINMRIFRCLWCFLCFSGCKFVVPFLSIILFASCWYFSEHSAVLVCLFVFPCWEPGRWNKLYYGLCFFFFLDYGEWEKLWIFSIFVTYFDDKTLLTRLLFFLISFWRFFVVIFFMVGELYFSIFILWTFVGISLVF